MGLASAFLILSFYSVVGGWVLDFILRSATHQFAGHTDAEIQGMLGTLFAAPLRQLLWHAVFMAATVAIVVQGLNAGLERWNRILMPALFVLLLLLLARAVFLPGFGQALSFLFTPHTERLTAAGVLEAVGHSFFTLSLGMGAMITYGSYLRTSGELTRTVLSVAVLDTLVALTAGVVIFSVVFTFGLEPGSGPTLMFQTLPMLFAKMPGGYLVSLAFFLLVAFAALTSAISLLEVVVTYWVETHGTSRRATALVLGGIVYLLGVLSALSTNLLANVKLFGLTFFDLADKLTSSVTLPLGGALIALFFGWVLGRRAVAEVVGERFATPLLWTVRVLAPMGVVAMIVNGLSGW